MFTTTSAMSRTRGVKLAASVRATYVTALPTLTFWDGSGRDAVSGFAVACKEWFCYLEFIMISIREM